MLMIDRRIFLKSAGAAFVAGLSHKSAFALSKTDAVFAAAYMAKDGSYGVATLSEEGAIIDRYALPDRGHDIVRHPHKNEMVAFARRPGTFAIVIDHLARATPHTIAAIAGRHFYGHGLYSGDGTFLFATENDFENARGVIGIYEAHNNYRRVGEFDAFGVGPHDIDLLPDGKTMVIANGGIETHPDFARTKLNISSMRPNLTFIDIASGALISSYELPSAMHKLSIRHIAMLDDTVWFACQNEGDIAGLQALVGSVNLSDAEIKILDLPSDATASMRGYVGSIAANVEMGLVGFTSPRGGMTYQIDAASRQLVSLEKSVEVCGVAPTRDGFCFSSGEGQLADKRTHARWDNHIQRLSL